MPQKDMMRKCIGIPYFRGEKHINTKWRDPAKNFRFEGGAELCLYGLNHIADSDICIWVEGEMDKLALYEAGLKECVSVPNGAPAPNTKNYSSKFDFLKSDADSLANKKHFLCVDNDDAGQAITV